ncbi:hypothetical protein DM02DRAFT_606279 [Periconia macrospinosa]|uniref:Large ribosomal subunit protein mL49 n=1 Tax=Periconia macrospinosa TaxID=97972 RepID=A0A2V1D237_9PLEO|nr:hypothetical protein DM02DRAFT_606279 [Periconia macrospinosa]
MPSAKSLLPLWRPLTAPIPRHANHQFLRFSTATRLRVPKTPSSTPQDTREAPSPSRVADLAAAEAATDADSAQPPAPKPTLPSQRDTSSTPTTSNSPTVSQAILEATESKKATTMYSPPPKPAPKYLVSRTKTKNLRVYTDFKRGGNLHLTTIQKVTGDLHALKEDITVYLNKKKDDVSINSLTQSVIVKGLHKPEIEEFLVSKGM